MNVNDALKLAVMTPENSIVITFLIETCKADPNCRDENGNHILALCNNDEGNVLTLLDHGSNCSAVLTSKGNTLLHITSSLEVAKRCVENKASLEIENIQGYTPLMHQTYDDNMHIVKYLIESGANPNKDTLYKMNPLMVAAQAGNLTMFKYFAEYNDISLLDIHGENVLHMACQESAVEIIEHILTNKDSDLALVSKNLSGESSLFHCVRMGDTTTLELLLMAMYTRFADSVSVINSPCNGGLTCLIVAVDRQYPDCVDVLVRYGADIYYKRQEDGLCAISLAFKTENREVIEAIAHPLSHIPYMVPTKTDCEDKKCFICRDYKKALVLNCGHYIMCSKCVHTVLKSKPECPLCRQNISQAIKIIE